MINWFMVHYTAGAAGKMIAVCVQTSPGFHAWFDPEHTDPVAMAHRHHGDRRLEPQSPYRLAWYCKTPPWQRGHDLTAEEAESRVGSEFQPRGRITVYHTHPNLPAWFQGTRIRITNDSPREQAWLYRRRHRLFYRQTPEGVVDLRLTPMASRPEIVRQFPTNTPDPGPMERVMRDSMAQERITLRSEHDLALAAILEQEPDLLLDHMDRATGSRANRPWCREYIQAWRTGIDW